MMLIKNGYKFANQSFSEILFIYRHKKTAENFLRFFYGNCILILRFEHISHFGKKRFLGMRRPFFESR